MDFEDSSADRFAETCGQGELAFLARFVEYPTVVEASDNLHLLVVLMDVSADRFGFGKVVRRAGDISYFACGDQCFVDGDVFFGVQHKLVVENRAFAFAFKVEVGVLGEVHRRRFVGGGMVVDDQGVLVGQCVGYGDLQVAGVVFFHVFCEIGQHELVFCGVEFCIPNDFIKTDGSAVQVVPNAIFLQFIILAVERKTTVGDAVAVATDKGTEVGLVDGIHVTFDAVVAEYDVGKFSVTVSNENRRDDGPVVGDLDGHAAVVRERVELDGVEIFFDFSSVGS